MKVLITTDWYKPAINGVVTSVCNLREELQQRGHEVKILTLSRTARSYEEEGVIYMGSVNAGYIYPGARLRVSPGRELYRGIIEWNPDIVHSQCEFSTFFMASTYFRKYMPRKKISAARITTAISVDLTNSSSMSCSSCSGIAVRITP